MGDAFGWTNNGRQVFDAATLEGAASDLRKLDPEDLKQRLLSALVPPEAFGQLRGGPDAALRLKAMYDSMRAELHKVGIDLDDLAVRTLAAAQAAHDVDPATVAAARRAMRADERG